MCYNFVRGLDMSIGLNLPPSVNGTPCVLEQVGGTLTFEQLRICAHMECTWCRRQIRHAGRYLNEQLRTILVMLIHVCWFLSLYLSTQTSINNETKSRRRRWNLVYFGLCALTSISILISSPPNCCTPTAVQQGWWSGQYFLMLSTKSSMASLLSGAW